MICTGTGRSPLLPTRSGIQTLSSSDHFTLSLCVRMHNSLKNIFVTQILPYRRPKKGFSAYNCIVDLHLTNMPNVHTTPRLPK